MAAIAATAASKILRLCSGSNTSITTVKSIKPRMSSTYRYASGDSSSYLAAIGIAPATKQVYGVATNDKFFKFKLFLNEEKVRHSFFNAFIPGLAVTASQVAVG